MAIHFMMRTGTHFSNGVLITPIHASFNNLERLAGIAEEANLCLIVTGLGAYRLSDAQPWYDELNDMERWQMQRVFWKSVAMTRAIRSKDEQTMITLGLLPLGPIHSIADHYDVLSTHIYPTTGNVQASVNYVLNNQSEKPFLMSEIYNLSCTTDDLVVFLDQIDGNYHGLVGHYFGKTIEEYDTTILVEWIHKEFLDFFIENNPN